MAGIFDVFKPDYMKQREQEMQAEIAYIRSKKEVEHEVYNSLTTEFKVDESAGLKQTASAEEPPAAILRHENQAFSMWHRLSVRGESRTSHIVDFAIFRGTHRIANKANPDFIIECRQLEGGQSHRLDTRVVRDIVGLAAELLPGIAILATNRELTESARGLAAAYGIPVIDMHSETAGRKLLELIASDKQTTREGMLKTLEGTLGKLDTIIVRRAATPWGKRVLVEKQERLKDRVLKELSRGKSSPSQIASDLHTHIEFVLNELYALEKENKARIVERSLRNQETDNVWAQTLPGQRR